ncbi:MAG: hypothetical protein KDK91_33705, partial [Gammaproteobacteria bacterium]|nr:hypothetical protein [Gammaproteobacteria bacterium]
MRRPALPSSSRIEPCRGRVRNAPPVALAPRVALPPGVALPCALPRALKRRRPETSIWLSLLACLLLAVLCIPGQARAEAVPVDLSALVPSTEHRRATDVVVKLMERYHYKRVPIEDQLSGQIFERYLESLDPQRSFFLRADIDEFEYLRYRLDDALLDARLGPAFDIFKRFRQRVTERAAFATSLLSRQLDFDRDEEYVFDREDAPWIASLAEMNDLWRKRVKND